MSATVVPMPAREQRSGREPMPAREQRSGREPLSPGREPLWREVVGDVLRAERLAQHRTLKDVATSARVSLAYLSEVERGRKEASSEVLAAATGALGIGLADLVDAARTRLQPAPARTGEVTNLAA